VSVETVGVFSLRRDLVQVNDLDPEVELVGRVSSAGDGTGGFNRITFTMPDGFAYLFTSVNAEMNASSTSNVNYVITSFGGTVFQSGAAASLVDVFNIPHVFPPPRVMLFGPVVLRIMADNTNLEALAGGCVAYGWDLQTARNIPQRFMWPGTMD